MACDGNVSPDSSALPRFKSVTVRTAQFNNCPPPARGFVAALSALGLTVSYSLKLKNLPRAPLTTPLFANLTITSLEIESNEGAWLAANWSADLASPSDLTLYQVSFIDLPRNLTSLHIALTGTKRLPSEAVYNLNELYVTETDLTDIKEWGGDQLRVLTLDAPVGGLPRLPRLENLTLDGWNVSNPEPFTECSQLLSLTVLSEQVISLPEDWLTACSALYFLKLQLPNAVPPPGLLAGAGALRTFVVLYSNLYSLPDGFFSGTPNLTTLHLTYNNFMSTPSAIFSLRNLRELDLSGNPLGDVCDADGYFARGALGALRELSLVKCGARRLCADWLLSASLRRLKLKNNNITRLHYRDLHPVGIVELDLRGNRVATIDYSEEECEAALRRPGDGAPAKTTILKSNWRLVCNCSLHAFAVALKRRAGDVRFSHAPRCGGHGTRSVADMVGTLRCAAPACGDTCTCEAEAKGEGCRAERTALAECGALPAARALAAAGAVRRLALRPAPAGAARAAARALFAPNRTVALYDVRFRCECGDRDLVDTLIEFQYQVENFTDLYCSDNRTLASLNEMECARGTLLPSPEIWAPAVAVAVALAIALASVAIRTLRKKKLANIEIVRTYDVFVSYSHGDERFVVEELVPELERTHRLCLHYRDWRAGDWVPAQITASVASSHCTLLVVSEHFARSDWARAEFREALRMATRGGPRPLAVLLERPRELDADLAAFLDTYTYVKWGEPDFWEKLRRALPPVRRTETLPR